MSCLELVSVPRAAKVGRADKDRMSRFQVSQSRAMLALPLAHVLRKTNETPTGEKSQHPPRSLGARGDKRDRSDLRMRKKGGEWTLQISDGHCFSRCPDPFLSDPRSLFSSPPRAGFREPPLGAARSGFGASLRAALAVVEALRLQEVLRT